MLPQDPTQAQITNRDGSAATDPVHVYSGDRDARTPSIAVLENDSFVITWNGDGDIYGRVFDFDGSPVEDYYLLEDEVAEIDLQALLANDDLEENNSFVFNLDSATSENGASLSFDEDSGLIFYDPTAATNLQALAEGEVLEDTFTYTIEDEFGRSDQATVTILVGGLDEVIG